MNTGSLVLITEDLGLSFYQYHGLGRALGLSKDTIEFLHKWTIKCESCGRHFSPKLNTPNRIKKCYFCRKTWRQFTAMNRGGKVWQSSDESLRVWMD